MEPIIEKEAFICLRVGEVQLQFGLYPYEFDVIEAILFARRKLDDLLSQLTEYEIIATGPGGEVITLNRGQIDSRRPHHV